MAYTWYLTRVCLIPHVGFDPAGIWTCLTVTTMYNQLRQPMADTWYLTRVCLIPHMGFDPAALWTYPTVATTYIQLRQPMPYTMILNNGMLISSCRIRSRCLATSTTRYDRLRQAYGTCDIILLLVLVTTWTTILSTNRLLIACYPNVYR